MRAAVLGQGSIGRRHAGNLLNLGHDVVAWDPAADAIDGASAADSSESALRGADVAVIASPSSEHATQALQALAAGCHVLVEKPLALSSAEAAAVVADAQDRALILGVAMNLRFHPAVTTVHDVVRSGAIGRPLLARAWFGSWLPGWRPGTDYRQGYSAQASLGGGILLDAVHELDYLTWILGPAASLSATLRSVPELETDVEDLAQIQLQHETGAESLVTLDYLDRAYDRGCRIVGADGSVAWCWGEAHVTSYGPEGQPTLLPAEHDVAKTYRAELAAFLDAVSRQAPPPVPGSTALHAMAIIDAARRSNRTGERAKVECQSSA